VSRTGETECTHDSPGDLTTLAPDASPSSGRGASLPSGRVLGRYVVLGRLGSGGMGVVYSAYNPELDSRVAIKVLHTAPCDEAESLGRVRLLREAQAMPG
jgi:eukaryotic-like serine/threonine-protein kinase